MKVLLASTLAFVLALVLAHTRLAPGTPEARTATVAETRILASHYLGLSARTWAARYWQRTIQYRHVVHAYQRTRRTLMSHPSVTEAINLACATYGNCETLWRKADCETGGTFDPRADNPGSDASGLFQFMPSTFASTPYARLSIWSPYANALAAGWMHQEGRGGEWVCQ